MVYEKEQLIKMTNHNLPHRVILIPEISLLNNPRNEIQRTTEMLSQTTPLTHWKTRKVNVHC